MSRPAQSWPTALALAIALAVVGGCKIDKVQTPSCVRDDQCGGGYACIGNACIPQGVPQGGSNTWAIELAPRSDSASATTQIGSVTFNKDGDITVLTADAKVTVTGKLAQGASLAGGSHITATVETAIPGNPDLQFDADSSGPAPDMSPPPPFTLKVPASAIGKLATFHLTPLPPRDLAQPPVSAQVLLAPAIDLSYSSNFLFIVGRLISPAQEPQSGFMVRAFDGGQLVSSVDTTKSDGLFRLAVPVEAAGHMLTVELALAGTDAVARRFATPAFAAAVNTDLGDLKIPPLPAATTFRLKVADPSMLPVAGAVVRVHTDIAFDRSGAIDFTRDGTTDASGNVDLALVVGTTSAPRFYDIAVLPPLSSRFGSACVSGFALTDATPGNSGAPAIITVLSVPEKATLPGTILSADGVGVAGVTIAANRTAVAPAMSCGKAALVSPPTSATTGRDGSYQLALDPGTYQFDYDPPAGAPVPRLTETNVAVTPGGNATRVVQMLSGALIKGIVRGSDGNALPSAGVRFFEVTCVGRDACFGANRIEPLLRADTHTDTDGSFRAVVPLQLPPP
jgi:hypothetical protein